MRAFAIACLLSSALLGAQDTELPEFDYETARAHEIPPHRRIIPMKAGQLFSDQINLRVVVSPSGDVIDIKASGQPSGLKLWPQIVEEVRAWKFKPFEQNGEAVAALVQEYVDFAPPERFPERLVMPPPVREDSDITITLQRTACFGSCPSYTVTLSTGGIVFDADRYVVAPGKHTAPVARGEVRSLAKRFVEAQFYSMDAEYRMGVTDSPTYILTITIDGRSKKVVDYVGRGAGMPGVISDLENEVDKLAKTGRWIAGSNDVVDALRAERFDFHTYDAQVMLKDAASRGRASTVVELLKAGVPLEPLPPTPRPAGVHFGMQPDSVGWLESASAYPSVLETLIAAGASKRDQAEKNAALLRAVRFGNASSIRLLVAYGADVNFDLPTTNNQTCGSVLICATELSNPETVREILRYHPQLDKRDSKGRTALLAAVESRSNGKDPARVEVLRLLAEAGADVNVRDKNGNTPLHKTPLTDVAEELMRLGADVNARNNAGETPIFTTMDEHAIPLLIAHGADVTILNDAGETLMEAARHRAPNLQTALWKALAKQK